jgi:CBS domain-containing protein
MTTAQAQLDTTLEELTQLAFDAFCDDIAGMFDCSMQTIEPKTLRGPLSQLQKDFKRITSINGIEATGALNGKFAIWFDQAAIFILSGVVVMLPEKRILENVKSGGVKEAQSLNDAIKELGNLMAGSWDRIFREGLSNHKHLKLGSVFIGQPWKEAKEANIDLDTECLVITAKIKVSSFEPVLCAAVYPIDLISPKPEPEPQPEAVAENKTPVAESKPELSPQQPQIAIENKAVPAKEVLLKTPSPQSEAIAENKTPAVNNAANAEKGGIKNDEKITVGNVETIEQPTQSSPVSRAIEQLVHSTPLITSQPDHSAPRHFSPFDLNSPIQTLVNTEPVWIDPEDSIQKAILLMQQHNTGYLLTGKNGQLEGILSRSDIAAAISPYTKSIFANYRRPLDDATFQIRVKWFICRPVRAVVSETPIGAAIDIMCKYAVRSLVILDSHQTITGLITTFDILKKLISTDGSVLTGAISQSPPFLMEMKSEA